ncbi:MAG: hypothetical protein HYV76_00025 [Candidatus Vogelbacteria bacterium]|nr:hypothetical protein [Candidatus Vogelbacteria bacterium]
METNLNPTQENSPGPLIGSILIIIILIIGGVYIFKQNWIKPANTTPPTAEELKTQGTSTKLEDIKADIEDTNIDNLDAELEQIEAELKL